MFIAQAPTSDTDDDLLSFSIVGLDYRTEIEIRKKKKKKKIELWLQTYSCREI